MSHSYPHSWRSKAPLIYRATPQWFISMKKMILEKAIKAINNTVFYPNKGKERLLSMVEGSQIGVFQDKGYGSSFTNIY